MKHIKILEKVEFSLGFNTHNNPDGDLPKYKQDILAANGITYKVENPDSIISASITLYNINVTELRFYIDLINNIK